MRTALSRTTHAVVVVEARGRFDRKGLAWRWALVGAALLAMSACSQPPPDLPPDSGVSMPPPDAGMTDDGGMTGDGGLNNDAGTTGDGGVNNDGGMTTDAGPRDAGPPGVFGNSRWGEVSWQ